LAKCNTVSWLRWVWIDFIEIVDVWRVTRIYASQNVQEKMKKKNIANECMVCKDTSGVYGEWESERGEENETFKYAKKVAIILIARSLQLAIALLT
jgi:hypothetical protein